MKEDTRTNTERPDEPSVELLIGSRRDDLKSRFPVPPRRLRAASATRKIRPASIAACLLGALALWLFDPVYQQENYASPPGKRQEVMLADGTRLDLDLASSLTVRWRLRTREVELHAGRVLFSVAPTRLRPFEVLADDIKVRVLGTRFDVRRQAGDVSVKVAEGLVSVEDHKTAHQLTRGQQISRQDGELGSVKTIAPESVLGWREGRLYFSDTPLLEALAEFQPQLQQPVRILGKARELAVSGVFNSQQGDDFLALLPEILPISINRQADGTLEIRQK